MVSFPQAQLAPRYLEYDQVGLRWWVDLRTYTAMPIYQQCRTGGMQGNPMMNAGLLCNFYEITLIEKM